MAELASLVVRLTGDISKFSSSMDAAAQKMRQVGASMTNIGQNMTLGVTAPLALAGVAAVKAASDLEESMNKVAVVFGESASEVQKWATTTADAFGISQQQALEATGTFGNLFRAMGMGQGPAAEMSKSLVELAADLASFNNIPIDVALEKLRAGLVGEVEPLRTLGVQMNAAAVTAKALEMGLAKSAKELTEADKVAARYALIMEQTALAQGDFTRTSDGLANSTRILRAMMGDLASQIGQVLIPVATRLAGWLREVMNIFLRLSPRMRQTIVVVAGLAAAIGPLLMIVGRVASGFGALASILPLLTGPFGIIIAVVAAIIAGFALLVRQTGSIQGALAALGIDVDALGALWQSLKQKAIDAWEGIRAAIAEVVGWLEPKIQSFVSTVTGWFDDNWPRISAVIEKVFGAIRSVVTTVVGSVVPFILRMFGNVKTWVDKNWPLIKQTIRTVLDSILRTVETVVGGIERFWIEHGDNITRVVTTAWGIIQGTIEGVINGILFVIQTVLKIINGDWQGAWNDVKAVAETKWGELKTAAETKWEEIKSAIKQKIDEALASVGTWLSDTYTKISAYDLKAAAETMYSTIITGLGPKLSEASVRLGIWLSATYDEINMTVLTPAAETMYGTILPGIGTKLSEASGKLGKWLSDTATEISTYDLAGPAAAFMKQLADAVVYGLDDIFFKIENYDFGAAATKAFGTILGPIIARNQEALAEIGKWLSETATKISNFSLEDAARAMGETANVGLGAKLSDASVAIGTWLTDTAKKISEFDLKDEAGKLLGTVTSAILTWAGDALGKIGKWLSDVGKKINEYTFKSDTLKAMQTVVSGILEAAANIYAEISSMLSKIGGQISGHSLFADGVALIQSFVNGIASMAGAVMAAIAKIISDAWAAVNGAGGTGGGTGGGNVPQAVTFGQNMIMSMVTGAQSAEASARAGIENVVSNIINAVTGMMRSAGGAAVGGSLGALIQFVSDFVRAFSEAITWFTTTSTDIKARAEAFATTAQGMIDTLLGAIDLLASLGGVRIPTNGAAFVRPLAQFLSDIIREMLNTITWVTVASIDVKARAEAFAAAALDLLETLAAGVELITAIGDIRITTSIEGFLYRLVGLISNVVQLMAQRIAPLTVQALAAVRVFSEAAKPVLEVMQQAVDTINAIGNVRMRDLTRQVAYIADRIVGMTNNIRRVAEYLGTRGVEAARKFAEAAGPVLEAMTKAVDAINGVQTIKIMDVSQQVAYMADRIIGMTFQLKRVAGYMSKKSVRAAAEFAAAVAPVLTIIKSAVDAIADLQTLPRDLPDLKPAIRALSDMLAALTTALRKIAEDVGVSAAKAAAEFATAVGPVVDIVKDAVEALSSLVSVNWNLPEDLIDRNMQALADFIYALAVHLSAVAAAVDLTLLKVASELAEIIRKPFEMIKLAIDTFNAVAGWNVATGVFDKLDTLISHIWNVLRKIRAIRDPFTEEVMGDIKWIVENVIPALQMLQDAMKMIANIGQIDLSSLAVVAYNSGVNWIHALADGIRGGLSYLESALQAVANLFPHSPAKTGPLRREPDWSTWMLAGFRDAWHDAGALASSLPPIAGTPGAQMMPAGAPVYNVTIHNPKREAAEDSLRRELMFLAAGVA